MEVDRDSVSFLIFHYLLLISIIFGGFLAIERIGFEIPFWVGLLLALLIGLGYPRVVRMLDVAPTKWE